MEKEGFRFESPQLKSFEGSPINKSQVINIMN